MTNEFDAPAFFRMLTERNSLARFHGFRFAEVSDLEGFAEILGDMQQYAPLICVSDTSDGRISLDNTPSTSRVKTVFMFMPHPVQDDWVAHRKRCFDIMREIFRQFLTVMIREHTRLHLDGIYLERDITFQEIDRYFFSGGACAFYNIAIQKNTDLQLRQEEWTEPPIPPRLSRLDANTPRPSTTQ